jgi:hypothetical protein
MTNNDSSMPLGGSYSDLKKHYAGTGETKQIHHMPAYGAYKNVTSMTLGEGSCIVMDKQDHRETSSCGRGADRDAYREEQKQLIAAGKIVEAFEMDKADLRAKFDNKYDLAVGQSESYFHQTVIPKLEAPPASNNPDKLHDLKQNSPKSDLSSANSVEQKLGHLKANSPQTQDSPSSKPNSGLSPNR